MTYRPGHTSHVTRHTSHVTRHTSHITRHTSHVTRHTSHVTRHTSHVTLAGDPMPQHGSISCDFVGVTRLQHPQPATSDLSNTADCPLPAADGRLGLSFVLAQTVRYAFRSAMWLKDADNHCLFRQRTPKTFNPKPLPILHPAYTPFTHVNNPGAS